MNRTYWTKWAGALFVAALALCWRAPGEDVTLSGGGDLADAVDKAESGDTISLRAGTYNLTNTLTIDKPLTIVGTGVSVQSGDTVNIYGGGAGNSCDNPFLADLGFEDTSKWTQDPSDIIAPVSGAYEGSNVAKFLGTESTTADFSIEQNVAIPDYGPRTDTVTLQKPIWLPTLGNLTDTLDFRTNPLYSVVATASNRSKVYWQASATSLSSSITEPITLTVMLKQCGPALSNADSIEISIGEVTNIVGDISVPLPKLGRILTGGQIPTDCALGVPIVIPAVTAALLTNTAELSVVIDAHIANPFSSVVFTGISFATSSPVADLTSLNLSIGKTVNWQIVEEGGSHWKRDYAIACSCPSATSSLVFLGGGDVQLDFWMNCQDGPIEPANERFTVTVDGAPMDYFFEDGTSLPDPANLLYAGIPTGWRHVIAQPQTALTNPTPIFSFTAVTSRKVPFKATTILLDDVSLSAGAFWQTGDFEKTLPPGDLRSRLTPTNLTRDPQPNPLTPDATDTYYNDEIVVPPDSGFIPKTGGFVARFGGLSKPLYTFDASFSKVGSDSQLGMNSLIVYLDDTVLNSTTAEQEFDGVNGSFPAILKELPTGVCDGNAHTLKIECKTSPVYNTTSGNWTWAKLVMNSICILPDGLITTTPATPPAECPYVPGMELDSGFDAPSKWAVTFNPGDTRSPFVTDASNGTVLRFGWPPPSLSFHVQVPSPTGSGNPLVVELGSSPAFELASLSGGPFASPGKKLDNASTGVTPSPSEKVKEIPESLMGTSAALRFKVAGGGVDAWVIDDVCLDANGGEDPVTGALGSCTGNVVLDNSNFDAGPSGWTEAPSGMELIVMPEVYGVTPSSPSYSAWLGNTLGKLNKISQSLNNTLPSPIVEGVTLSGYYNVKTPSSNSDDTLEFYLGESRIDELPFSAATDGWKYFEFSDFRGYDSAVDKDLSIRAVLNPAAAKVEVWLDGLCLRRSGAASGAVISVDFPESVIGTVTLDTIQLHGNTTGVEVMNNALNMSRVQVNMGGAAGIGVKVNSSGTVRAGSCVIENCADAFFMETEAASLSAAQCTLLGNDSLIGGAGTNVSLWACLLQGSGAVSDASAAAVHANLVCPDGVPVGTLECGDVHFLPGGWDGQLDKTIDPYALQTEASSLSALGKDDSTLSALCSSDFEGDTRFGNLQIGADYVDLSGAGDKFWQEINYYDTNEAICIRGEAYGFSDPIMIPQDPRKGIKVKVKIKDLATVDNPELIIVPEEFSSIFQDSSSKDRSAWDDWFAPDAAAKYPEHLRAVVIIAGADAGEVFFNTNMPQSDGMFFTTGVSWYDSKQCTTDGRAEFILRTGTSRPYKYYRMGDSDVAATVNTFFLIDSYPPEIYAGDESHADTIVYDSNDRSTFPPGVKMSAGSNGYSPVSAGTMISGNPAIFFSDVGSSTAELDIYTKVMYLDSYPTFSYTDTKGETVREVHKGVHVSGFNGNSGLGDTLDSVTIEELLDARRGTAIIKGVAKLVNDDNLLKNAGPAAAESKFEPYDTSNWTVSGLVARWDLKGYPKDIMNQRIQAKFVGFDLAGNSSADKTVPISMYWLTDPAARVSNFSPGSDAPRTLSDPVFNWILDHTDPADSSVSVGPVTIDNVSPCKPFVKCKLWRALDSSNYAETQWYAETDWSDWVDGTEIDKDTRLGPNLSLEVMLNQAENMGALLMLTLCGMDEAGNIQDVTPANGAMIENLAALRAENNGGTAPNVGCYYWVNPGSLAVTLETAVSAHFWWNQNDSIEENKYVVDANEQDFGSATMIPLPDAALCHTRVEAQFNIRQIVPDRYLTQDEFKQERYIVCWDLFEDNRLVATGKILGDKNVKTLTLPQDIFTPDTGPFNVVVHDNAVTGDYPRTARFLNRCGKEHCGEEARSAYQDRLGDDGDNNDKYLDPEDGYQKHRTRDVNYELLAYTALYDSSGNYLIKDSTPASVRFTITVPRTVSTDSPIKSYSRGVRK